MNKTLYKAFKDYRLWCVVLTLTAILYNLTEPKEIRPVAVHRFIVIVDITRSMNAEDYTLEGKPISRLDYVKYSLSELLSILPCQSTFGLGIFTDRRISLLLDPIEVCSGYTELQKVIETLDWRMAWAADSRIASGLRTTFDMLKDRDENIIFLTDGQEAPPVNPLYRTDFKAVKGQLTGMIVGVGGEKPVPIPKYNLRGERTGVYQPDDVPHRSTFGVSDLNPEQLEGYDARNAPFGSVAVVGQEHLTALKASYLHNLATEAGFDYYTLSDTSSFIETVKAKSRADQVQGRVDIRWRYTLLGVLALACIWI